MPLLDDDIIAHLKGATDILTKERIELKCLVSRLETELLRAQRRLEDAERVSRAINITIDHQEDDSPF